METQVDFSELSLSSFHACLYTLKYNMLLHSFDFSFVTFKMYVINHTYVYNEFMYAYCFSSWKD